MKRWLSMVLMIAAVLSALTVGVSAADGDEVTLDSGLVLTEKSGAWNITGYTGNGGRLVIPETYRGQKITLIVSKAFNNTAGKRLTDVVIPGTVSEIGESAFDSCKALKSVVFLDPEENITVKIGTKAFANCDLLGRLVLTEGLKTIGVSAFAGAKALTEVVIPKGVTKIDELAFSYTGLKTVFIPVEVGNKSIDETAFSSVKLESLHYGCGQEGDPKDLLAKFEIGALPNGLKEEVIHKALYNRTVTKPTCTDPSNVIGGAVCLDYDKTTDTCGILDESTEIPALGHDWVQTEASVKSMEAAQEKHDLVPCMDHDYEYASECSRCKALSAEKPETKQIKATDEHTWDEKDGYLDKEKEDEIVKPTCAVPGSTPMKRVCTREETWTDPDDSTITENLKCGKVEEWVDHPKSEDENGVVHTFFDGNSIDVVEVKPTCKYYGIKVTYLLCDGRHTENNVGLKPCVLGVDGANKCKELLDAFDNAVKALEDAAAAYTPPADGTVPEETPLKAERDAVQAAYDAYRDHVLKDHQPIGDSKVDPDTNTECIVSVDAELEAEGDGHPTSITLGKSEITAPDGGKYNCVEGGVYMKRSFCPYCGEIFEEPVTVDALPEHKVPKDKKKTTDATCTAPAKIEYLEGAVCEVCNTSLAGQILEVGTAKGHQWKDFQQTEVTKQPTCAPGKAEGTATCEVCGAVEELTIELAPIANHTWGPWIKSEDGKSETRTCSVCGEKQTHDLTPEEPDDPENPDDPNKPEEPDKPDPDAVYTITVTTSNGTVTPSATSAKAGTTITFTATPSSGFELDLIRVIGGSSVVSWSDLGSGRYHFTMPASNVTITVSFSLIDTGSSWGGVSNGTRGDPPRSKDNTPKQIVPQSIPKASAWDQIFSDIPTGHWAAGEINWANQMGYMNGSGGRFNPDATITAQQMWMVLARLTGNYPANMADARRWAVEHSFADGSSPTGAVARHQLVTALYRVAHLRGGASRGTASLAGFADSRIVPTVAREAFAWAVSNGIVSGTANNRLDPNGTVTRAQFAVILYRFSQKA